ncbi:hypothetical protein, partial [Glaesserella parasuis]|uniref:hypothetical protein n=1 Tax=Glaesserella parasuis TaxID=738 RepID=UPI003F342CC7
GLLGGLVLAALALLQVGRRQGKSQAKQEQHEADQSAREHARVIENETAAMSDTAITDELKRDWVRGPRW